MLALNANAMQSTGWLETVFGVDSSSHTLTDGSAGSCQCARINILERLLGLEAWIVSLLCPAAIRLACILPVKHESARLSASSAAQVQIKSIQSSGIAYTSLADVRSQSIRSHRAMSIAEAWATSRYLLSKRICFKLLLGMEVAHGSAVGSRDDECQLR